MATGVRMSSRQQARGWCAREGQAWAITVETAAGGVGNHKVGEIVETAAGGVGIHKVGEITGAESR